MPSQPIVGVPDHERVINELRSTIARIITPQPGVTVDVQESHGKKIIRILVPRGDDTPYAIDDNKIFVREEAETSLAVRDEIVQLVLRGQAGEGAAQPTTAATAVEPAAAAAAARPAPSAAPTPASAVHAPTQKIIKETKPYLRRTLEPIDDLLGSAEYKLYLTVILLERALDDAVNDTETNPNGTSPSPTDSHSLQLSVQVNGNRWDGSVPAEETLLEFIRIRLGLTGTKRSCESQVCGACTVLVEDQPVSSCNYLAFEAHNKSVLTIEGLAKGGQLDPLQEAFIRNVGAQCGFCTPGQSC